MQKIVIEKPGSYDQLKIKDLPDLVCGPDQVLIDVKYIGINYADVLVRWGVYKSAKELVGWPVTPGFEVSGVVKAVGSSVQGFNVDDEVLGITLFDGYSTEICLPAEQVFKVPSGMTLAQAATLPTVFLTAYHGLFQSFVTRPEMKFLIHSAAGGVGSALVQLARLLDCEVVGVIGRESKREYLEKLGVKNIICKENEDWAQRARELSPAGYQAVFDANGASTLKDSYELLAPTGKLVVYGFHSMLPKSGGRLNYLKLVKTYFQTPRFNPLDMTSDNKSVIAFNLSFLFEQRELLIEAMHYMLSAFEKGQLKPLEHTEFDFDKVADAHKAIESGKTVGKLILCVSTPTQ